MREDVIVGLFHDWDESRLVTYKKLCEASGRSAYTIRQYADWRYSTNLVRFRCDPMTGEIIDWAEILRRSKNAKDS